MKRKSACAAALAATQEKKKARIESALSKLKESEWKYAEDGDDELFKPHSNESRRQFEICSKDFLTAARRVHKVLPKADDPSNRRKTYE